MRIKFTAWGIMMCIGAALIAYVLYSYSSIHSPLNQDSRMVFSYALGLVIGFSILQTANTMKIRDELEKIKSQLKRAEEKS